MNELRRLATLGTASLAALLTLGIGAATASAAPLEMTFTEARANVGAQLDDDPLLMPSGTAAFNAEIDPVTGAITAGDLEMPDFSTHISEPVDAEVTVDFTIGTITGTFASGTGALAGTGTAGGTLTANGEDCVIATVPAALTLSTSGNSGGETPRSGTPFANGLTGSGAVAGEWEDMTAAPADPGDPGAISVCETVDEEIGGPGGVWLYQEGDVTPPAPPQLMSTNPASPNTNGTPFIVGTAEAGSTVRLYAGAGCAGSPLATTTAAELAAPGIAVEVAAGETATFSATATDPAGNVSPCSSPISYTREKLIPPPPPPPPAKECVVPKLKGKTLPRARKMLRRANCKLGEVSKPKRNKGKRKRPLIVKSSRPGAGATPASGKVNLKLKRKPKAKGKRPRR